MAPSSCCVATSSAISSEYLRSLVHAFSCCLQMGLRLGLRSGSGSGVKDEGQRQCQGQHTRLKADGSSHSMLKHSMSETWHVMES